MKKNISLLLILMLLFSNAKIAKAQDFTNEEILERQKYSNNIIKSLYETGQMSSNELFSVHVDLSNISNKTVTSVVYGRPELLPTTTVYDNICPQPAKDANDKLVRFFFYIGSNNKDHAMSIAGQEKHNSDTVIGYVYGEHKLNLINNFVDGIPDCLGNIRIWDNGSSSGGDDYIPQKPNIEKIKNEKPEWAEKYITSTFKIGDTAYNTAEKSEDDNNEEIITQTMDISPYIKNGRTYVPVRYLAYSLGVNEKDIIWDNEKQTISLNKDNIDIALKIGSKTILVNDKPKTMDVAPEITNDRTFLPARWIAEPFGATVEWDEKNQETTIKILVENIEKG